MIYLNILISKLNILFDFKMNLIFHRILSIQYDILGHLTSL